MFMAVGAHYLLYEELLNIIVMPPVFHKVLVKYLDHGIVHWAALTFYLKI